MTLPKNCNFTITSKLCATYKCHHATVTLSASKTSGSLIHDFPHVGHKQVMCKDFKLISPTTRQTLFLPFKTKLFHSLAKKEKKML